MSDSLILLALIICFPIAFALIGAYIYRKNVTTIKCHVLCTDGNEKVKKVGETYREFSIGKKENAESYTFTQQDVYHHGIRRNVYFIQGNPKAIPINVDLIKDRPSALKMTAKEVNDMMQERIMRIFTRQLSKDRLIMVLGLVFSVITMILIVGRYMQ